MILSDNIYNKLFQNLSDENEPEGMYLQTPEAFKHI